MVIKNKYITLLLLGLIFLEVALPHLLGLKSTYILLVVLISVIATQSIANFKQLQIRSFALYLILSFILYFLFCFISIFWSVTPSATLIHSSLYFIALFVVISAIRYETEKTVTILQNIACISMFLSWLALLISPEIALQQKGIWRLRGIFYHEFELGFLAAIVILILCIRWTKNGIKTFYGNALVFYSLFVFTLATLLATQTRTLLVYTVLCCAVIVIFYSKGKKRFLSILLTLSILSAFFVFQDQIFSTYNRGESDETLSGRTIIWERAINIASRSPLVGFGFGSFTSPNFDADFTGFYGSYRPPHAHNTWIMSYFETGLIGASLLTLFLILQLIYGFRLSKRLKEPSYGHFFALLGTLVGATSLIYGGKIAALNLIPLLLLLQQSRDINLHVKIQKMKGR